MWTARMHPAAMWPCIVPLILSLVSRDGPDFPETQRVSHPQPSHHRLSPSSLPPTASPTPFFLLSPSFLSPRAAMTVGRPCIPAAFPSPARPPLLPPSLSVPTCLSLPHAASRRFPPYRTYPSLVPSATVVGLRDLQQAICHRCTVLCPNKIPLSSASLHSTPPHPHFLSLSLPLKLTSTVSFSLRALAILQRAISVTPTTSEAHHRQLQLHCAMTNPATPSPSSLATGAP